MKVIYKDYLINCYKAKNVAGESMLYYSIFDPKNTEIDCGPYYGEESIIEYIQSLKKIVDNHIEHSEEFE